IATSQRINMYKNNMGKPNKSLFLLAIEINGYENNTSNNILRKISFCCFSLFCISKNKKDNTINIIS
ncbi:MAG: hypothetical protein ABL929_02245, partial [Ferruginibacter sp.]